VPGNACAAGKNGKRGDFFASKEQVLKRLYARAKIIVSFGKLSLEVLRRYADL
jgi:hypothetical protein